MRFDIPIELENKIRALANDWYQSRYKYNLSMVTYRELEAFKAGYMYAHTNHPTDDSKILPFKGNNNETNPPKNVS